MKRSLSVVEPLTAERKQALQDSVRDPSCGAVITFEGVVRNHNEGKEVRALFYEACESLALSEAANIFSEAKEKFAYTNAVCVHRTGELSIGDTAVYVAVTAGLGYGFDSYAVNIYGLVLPEIKKTLQITEEQEAMLNWLSSKNVRHVRAVEK